MASVLNFSDIGCLDESTAGSLGAGMASFVRAEFPTVRGFVVAPIVFTDFLDKDDVKSAVGLFKAGAEAPEESWRTVRSIFTKTRIDWNHEMEILAAFGELDSVVSVSTSSRYGSDQTSVYAGSGQDLLDAIKHCWVKWLKAGIANPGWDMPAVVVKEVLDSEISLELRRKGQAFRARAIFGLPEGLHDPAVSSDTFEFKPDGTLDEMEMRPQRFQYIMKDPGPSKVPLSGDFAREEKVTGDMLAGLQGIMSFMQEHSGISQCSICFVSSRPIICSAALMSDPVSEPVIPPRERSMSLLEPILPPKPTAPQGPVVGTKIFLQASNVSDILSVGESYADGIMVTGNPLVGKDWPTLLPQLASESKRLLRSGMLVMELADTSPGTMGALAQSLKSISENGMQAGVLIPGIRSPEELAKVASALKSHSDSASLEIWARVMYPSNLFFMDQLARASDVLALDLDSLTRLMLGGGEAGEWMHHAIPALETALEPAFRNKPGRMAILADDIISMPSMLEFLVRRGADILCVKPPELHTVKHIVASVEKRMLLEQGRS